MKNNKIQKTDSGGDSFYRDIVITDIRLHSIKATNPKSFSRKIEKSIRNKKPGRVYSNQIKLNQEGTFSLSVPISKEKESNKYKTRFFIPKNGIIPISMGKDLIEKMKSLNK